MDDSVMDEIGTRVGGAGQLGGKSLLGGDTLMGDYYYFQGNDTTTPQVSPIEVISLSAMLLIGEKAVPTISTCWALQHYILVAWGKPNAL